MPSHPPARVPRHVAAALLGASLLAAACAPSGPSASPGAPSPWANPVVPSASTGGIQHPTGPADVVLRVEVTGGFVPIETAAARVPVFTLYGHGRVVVQAVDLPLGEAPIPLREARLGPAEVQDLLAFAIGPGGLGIAATDYVAAGFIDAATTVITIDAGGVRKKLRVLALEAEPEPGPEQAAREAFRALVDRLRALPTVTEFVPAGFLAVLVETEPDPRVPPRAWPWPDLSPADFTLPPPDDPLGFPTHALSDDELGALDIDVPAGGLPGPTVEGPDGRIYLVVLRPLLPEETPAS